MFSAVKKVIEGRSVKSGADSAPASSFNADSATVGSVASRAVSMLGGWGELLNFGGCFL